MMKIWKRMIIYGTWALAAFGGLAFMPGFPGFIEAKAELSESTYPAGWKQDDDGWRYVNSEGTYLKGCFGAVNDVWYYFDQDEYMVTGWQQVMDDWYYFDPTGQMVTGPVLVGDTYYYFDNNGKLDRDFQYAG